MTFDGKLLARARGALARRRQYNGDLLERRRRTAYEKSGRIEELENEISATMPLLMRAALRGEDVAPIKERNLALQAELHELLTACGFRPDYLDPIYTCRKCSDTGYIGTKMCSCLLEQYRKEQADELSALLKLGSDTFDTFNLEFYSSVPDPNNDNISPRDNMESILDACWSYSNRFCAASPNFFFTGGTGLGKTFLSTCIAKVVSEKGFSVVYDTAGSVFAKFEEYKFSRSDNDDELKSDIDRYLNCDLLIIDDLGTEMTTSFTVSALYEIVNTRLCTNKKTIISSNLDPEAIKTRYNAQIYSRIIGQYQVLPFFGNDIRLLKKSI